MRTKINLRTIAAMSPNSILWDTEIPGLNARRQFSDVVTYSIVYRTLEGTQRWQRIGRHGVWTPELARKQARSVLIARDLGTIFSYAVKRKMRPDNPCRGIEKPKETKKTRRLSDAEYAQLGASLKGGIVYDVFLLLAVTGWRSSEAKNLRWAELGLERSIATLGDTKTGVSVRPLSSAAIDIIKRQQDGSAYVFDRQVNGN
jgi:integrase